MDKDSKKKTLTISSNLKKKIDTSAINTDGKKSFAVKKKEPFRANKNTTRLNQSNKPTKSLDPKKKNSFARKFVEQQATKAFIKKDDKPYCKQGN